MNTHTIYQLTITTLSPLHIGTGRTLQRDYDYVVHKGKTWVIDADALAQAAWSRGRTVFQQMVRGAPAAELLTASDYSEQSPLFRYILEGVPRSSKTGSEIQEQIKDAWDRPYIPGSSLKGGLRTALFSAAVEKFHPPINPREWSEWAKFAAQPLEHRVFSPKAPPGKFPNYDLLRALQVSDSEPDEERRLQLLNVQVVSGKKMASPIELEAIPRGVDFTATLTLDGFLLHGDVVARIGWEKQLARWLYRLPQVVNRFTAGLIEAQRRHWKNLPVPIRNFFFAEIERVVDRMDVNNEFIMQLGWGGGWDSKTLGALLTADEERFAQIVQRYKKQMLREGSFYPGDRYPKSRRVVVRGEKPFQPLGWIKVRMERIQ